MGRTYLMKSVRKFAAGRRTHRGRLAATSSMQAGLKSKQNTRGQGPEAGEAARVLKRELK
jgi:hypothetical protein